VQEDTQEELQGLDLRSRQSGSNASGRPTAKHSAESSRSIRKSPVLWGKSKQKAKPLPAIAGIGEDIDNSKAGCGSL
jgi:hypothetical protein